MAEQIVPDAAVPEQDITRLNRFKRMLDEFRNTMSEARARQQRDQDYYDDRQLTPRQREILRSRKQPEVWSNRIKPAVNGTIGVVARGKTDPRAYPRTPQDQDSADVASDVLRFIYDVNRFQRTKLLVLKDILVPGCGAGIALDGPGGDPVVEQIRWEEFFYDPHSRRDDFKDARYLGIAKWMYVDQLASMYPEHVEAINASTVTSAGGLGMFQGADGTFDDRPDNAPNMMWVDRKGRRLMVCEVYHLEGGRWRRAVFCSAAILEDGDSPYVDDRGELICAIEAQAAYVDRFNERMGMVRTMIPMQDTVNAARQRASHFLNMRQVQQADPSAPPVNADIARKEAAKPDGVIPPGWQIVPTTDIMQGNLALQQEAKGEIERMAPIPSLVGRADSSASGRAQLVQSQAGMTEFALIFDGFTDWEQRMCRQMWFRARQFKQDPWWIRVSGDDQATRLLQVNEVVVPPQPVVDPMTGQPVIDPETGQPQMTAPQMRNRLAEMDLDIIVDAVPDTANVQQEQWQELLALLQSNPAYAQEVPFSVALKMSSIVNKRELAKELEQASAQRTQQQQQVQQRAAQLGEAAAVADIEKTQSETAKNLASADETQAKATMGVIKDRIAVRAQLGGAGSFMTGDGQPWGRNGQLPAIS